MFETVLILTGCALLSACSRNHAPRNEVEDRIDACGVMVSKKGPPVPRALVEVYELPKDTGMIFERARLQARRTMPIGIGALAAEVRG